MNSTVAGLIWILLGIPIISFGILFVIEGGLYITQQRPITTYIRNWGYGHVFVFAIIGALLLVGVGMAVTHFVLDGPTKVAAH